jgi:SOS-response transcriptional repressor LexA
MTKRQHDYYVAIKAFIEKNGYSPHYQEIADLVGIKSLTSVAHACDRLAALGYVTFVGKGIGRRVKLLKKEYQDLTSCNRNHAQIWFSVTFCPLCELLMNTQQPPTQADVYRR